MALFVYLNLNEWMVTPRYMRSGAVSFVRDDWLNSVSAAIYRPTFRYISYQEIQTRVEMFSGWNLTFWELTSGEIEINMGLCAPPK